MSKVRVHISAAADGSVAGPNQSLENPFVTDGIEAALDRARDTAGGKGDPPR